MATRLRISNLIEGRAGEAAGLAKGDVLLSYDGTQIENNQQLLEAIQGAIKRSATQVDITVYREQRICSFSAKAGSLGLELRDTDFTVVDEMLERESSAGHGEIVSFEQVFTRLVGSFLKLNIEDPLKQTKVKAVAAGKDHFAVVHQNSIFRFPYSQVMEINETDQGEVSVVVNRLVIYKGAVGFGVGIPLG